MEGTELKQTDPRPPARGDEKGAQTCIEWRAGGLGEGCMSMADFRGKK